jgi:hypothetical protein
MGVCETQYNKFSDTALPWQNSKPVYFAIAYLPETGGKTDGTK